LNKTEESYCYTVNDVLYDEWSALCKKTKYQNMMQSWEYGNAKSVAEGWKPIRLVIKNCEEVPVAIVQVLYRGVAFIGGVARINRGPLILSGAIGKGQNIESDIYKAILLERKKRRWWLLFWAPEKEFSEKNIKFTREVNLKRRNNIEPWGSSRLSLKMTDDELMSNLKGKWRNMLRKAEKSGLHAKCVDVNSNQVDKLIESYKLLQQKNVFTGIPDNLLKSLATQKGDNWKFGVIVAYKDKIDDELQNEQQDGVLVIVVSGNTATYLIGYTNDRGRKNNANYLLIWHAILDAKKKGCDWFDLGGINKNTPKGIVHFKNGLNGDLYNLIGEFIYY